MKRLVTAPKAQQDICEIIAWTRANLGLRAASRYERLRLIEQAIYDVADDPMRAGSIPVPDLGSTVRTFHLRNSRSRAASGSNRVKRPRHFLLYRSTDEDVVEVSRILHDRMEIDESAQDPSR